MGRVRSKDTKPEMTVRRLTHGMGYRYRLHQKGLPGRPDLVFTKKRKVIWVHGCFWHRHANCKLARLPKSKQDFWIPKLKENKKRDERNQSRLEELGWEYLIIWECQLGDLDLLRDRIINFLGETK